MLQLSLHVTNNAHRNVFVGFDTDRHTGLVFAVHTSSLLLNVGFDVIECSQLVVQLHEELALKCFGGGGLWVGYSLMNRQTPTYVNIGDSRFVFHLLHLRALRHGKLHHRLNITHVGDDHEEE